jgi:hypothetical protein
VELSDKVYSEGFGHGSDLDNERRTKFFHMFLIHPFHESIKGVTHGGGLDIT